MKRTCVKPVTIALMFLLSSYTATLRAQCVLPPPGLVGWWPADGSPVDIAGPHPGTLAGGAQAVAGFVSSAFSLNGTSGYVSTTLDVQPSAMPNTTWEAWVYPTATGGRRQIFSSDDGGYDRSLMLEGTRFGIFRGNGVWTPADVVANQWTHVAVVFMTNNIEFYTNGVRFQLGAAPAFGATGNKLQIGRNPGYGEYFPGLIDEASVYARALTPAEIQSIHAAGASGKCKTVAEPADLSVTLAGPQGEVYRLNNITNTISVANAGPGIANSLLLTTTISPSLNFVTASGSYSVNGRVIAFYVAELPVGGTTNIQLVTLPNTTGPVTNSVAVSSANTDPNPGNDSADWIGLIGNTQLDALNGNWGHQNVVLVDTAEAALMIRAGDIDNLNFGWPAGFNPFSGNSTPGHSFPWAVNTNDAPGTDRIFVGSAYDGSPPRGQDGYTGSTSRPANLPQAIVLSNSMTGLTVSSAVLQMFVDDFQASAWGASYQVLVNGVRASFLEEPLNQLVQTGPVGRLITVQIPPGALSLVSTGDVTILIDDPVTGAGDGYAIDFAKLLLNPRGLAQSGTLQGSVRDTLLNQTVQNARISAAGGFAQTSTDAQGNYVLTNVPAGLVVVSASKFGYTTQAKTVNLVASQTETVNFQLVVEPKLRILDVIDTKAVLRWPAPLSNWILETASSLPPSGPGSWSSVVVDRTFVDGDTQALVPAVSSPAFYRLRKP